MIASEIRADARKNLTGKWGKAALLLLSFLAIDFLIFFILGIFSIIPFFGLLVTMAYYVVAIPMTYGMFTSFLKLKRGEEVGYVDFITTGFSSFGKVWGVIGYSILKYLPYIICIIVGFILIAFSTGFAFFSYSFGRAGIYASAGYTLINILSVLLVIGAYIALIPRVFSLALVFPILYDNPEMNGKDIVDQSIGLMQGHKWNLFWLHLTFIGWAILSAFTFYIGYLFLIPYIAVSFVCFYEALSHKEKTVEILDNKTIAETVEVKEETKEPIVEDTKQEEIVSETTEEEINPIQSDDDKKEE